MPVRYRDPAWQALQREAWLASRLWCGGLTSLKHANFAAVGHYYEAFFALSAALERGCKLSIVVSQYIKTGIFPSDAELKSDYSHNLVRLFNQLEKMAASGEVNPAADSIPPQDQRDAAMDALSFLANFAQRTRYYNLNLLGGRPGAGDDPLGQWRGLVLRHFPIRSPGRAERSGPSREVLSFLDSVSMVRHSREDSTPVTSFAEMAHESVVAEHLQRNGAAVCAHLVRYVASCLSSLSYRRHSAEDELPVFSEFCNIEHASDGVVRKRKTFDDYAPS